jgi:hypothetical protein
MAKKKNHEDDRLRPLEPQNCYVGQRVYWIMWRGADDGSHGWFRYKTGRKPEVWSAAIETITSRTVKVEHYGKLPTMYSCPQDAITAEYEHVCKYHILNHWAGVTVWDLRVGVPLGEASVILRDLADLEFNLHQSDRVEGETLEKYYTTPPEEL